MTKIGAIIIFSNKFLFRSHKAHLVQLLRKLQETSQLYYLFFQTIRLNKDRNNSFFHGLVIQLNSFREIVDIIVEGCIL